MNTKLRAILLATLGALLALPSVGDEVVGGENAGNGGVWILPAACFLAQSSGGLTAVRATHTASDLSKGCEMQLASNMGLAVASYVDDAGGSPVSLPVSGSVLKVSSQFMTSLVANGSTGGTIIVADATQKGYRICIAVVGGSIRYDAH